MPQLDSGVSGKTNELGMKQGQLGSFLQTLKKIWRKTGKARSLADSYEAATEYDCCAGYNE